MDRPSKEFKEYKKAIDKLGKQVFPQVVADALNSAATRAHIQSIRNLREDMVLRNKFTERSVRYYAAHPKDNWLKINAVTGSVSDYLPLQDEGGERRPKRGKAVSVATLAARGGDRLKVVRKKYAAGTLGPGQFVGIPKGGNRPLGVYERRGRGRRLVLIRNLSNPYVKVKPTHWHTRAVARYGTRQVIEAAFIQQARLRIAQGQ